jgi:hypothetical protein
MILVEIQGRHTAAVRALHREELVEEAHGY